jgi:general nucleoside transport system permease protein
MTDAAREPTAPLRRRFPYRVRFEKRITEPAWWFPPLVSLGAIVVALILGGGVIAAIGGDPWATYVHITRQSFGSWGVLSDTIVQATPLILVGLACAVAFRMRLWNIGAEGQFFLGALGASAVVLIPVLPAETSPWIMIPTMMVAGIAAGAVWGFIPGFLKAKLKVNEVITTLMMNYIAFEFVRYFVFGPWSDSGFQMSRIFPRTAWLPRLSDYAVQFPALRGMTTHLGLVFGLLAAVVVWLILYRSRWGYEIRLTGDNPQSAHYAGVNTTRNIILVMMFSGALAGLAGMSQISGVVHRLQDAISPGYGFTGIIIAWLAKLNPFMVVVVSVLFGALLLAGRQIQPSGIPKMIQGILLVSLIASDFLLRYRVRLERVEEEA